MPQIPTDFDVGRTPFAGGRLDAAASPGAMAAPGMALEQGGQQLTQAAAAFARQYGEAEAQKSADNLSFAAMQQLEAASVTWSKHPNAAEAVAGFNQDAQQIRDLAATASNDPTIQANVLNQLNRHSLLLGMQTQRQAFAAEASNWRATLDQQLSDAARSAAAATDPQVRQNIISQATGAIERSKNSGWLLGEDAYNRTQQFGRALALGMLDANPGQAAADLKAGKYNSLIDQRSMEALQPHIDAASGTAFGGHILTAALANGPPPPLAARPNASDSEIDAALAPIIQRESGGKPFVGYGGADLSSAPLDPSGFPIWEGKMGPAGMSHAAGILQIQPGTWRPIAEKLGIHDFSLDSQMRVGRELYRQQGPTPWAASAPPGVLPGAGGTLADMYRQIDQSDLNDTAKAHAKAYVRTNYDAIEADQLRQQRQQETQRRDNSLAAENEVIADTYSDAPKITPQQVANDPRLLPEARLRMIQVIRNGAEGGPAAGPSHAAALDLLNRIRLPEGDPQRIVSATPIYDALGANKLNKGDFDFVKKEFDQQTSAGGEVLAKRKAEFLKSIEPQIDPKGALGFVDPSAKQKFYQFQWSLGEKMEEYANAGKNPGDLLDPSKPDFAGKPEALKPFRSPFIAQMQDVTAKPAAAAPAVPALTPAAIEYLKAHPELRGDFDAKYGAGRAEILLRPSVPMAR